MKVEIFNDKFDLKSLHEHLNKMFEVEQVQFLIRCKDGVYRIVEEVKNENSHRIERR